MCTAEDHSLCAAKGQITLFEAHVLVNETGFTRLSLTKGFLLYVHFAHYMRSMGFRKWLKMGL